MSALRPAALVFSSLLLGVFAFACSDDGTGGAGASGGSAPQGYGQSECFTCVRAECEAELDACRAEPGCTAYLDCVAACATNDLGDADNECDEACAAATPEEAQRVTATVVSCRHDGPGVECDACGLPQGKRDVPESQMCEARPNPPTPCRACFWEKCCDTWDQCYGPNGNPECDAIVTCLIDAGCESPELESCSETCFEAHPTGVDDYIAQLTCANLHCAPEISTCDATQRDACSTCIFSECGESYIDLLSTIDGVLIYTCISDCGENAAVECIEACVTAHPEANGDFFLWAECVDYRCGEAEGC